MTLTDQVTKQVAADGDVSRPPAVADDGSPAENAGDIYKAAMRSFGEVAAALSEVTKRDPLLHLIADNMCELVGVGRCSVYLRDDETGLFRGQVGRADQDIDERVKHLVAGGEADRFTQEIVRTKEPVLVANALHDPRPVRSTMRAWGVRSMLGIPMVLRGEVIGIFFLDDAERVPVFTPLRREIGATFANLAAVAIKQAQAQARTRSSLHTAAVQNNILRQAVTMDDRLAELALTGAGLAEIAAAVAELSGKPTAIYDATHQQREFAVPPDVDAAIAASLLKPDFQGVADVREALASLGTGRPQIVGPFPGGDIRHRFLVAPITLRETLWGHIVLVELNRRFGALDSHIARRAATNVALELTAERRASASEWDGRASLASDLLRGDRDLASLKKRADFLGIDLTPPRVVCLLAADSGGALPSAHSVADALAGAGDATPALTTGVADGVVAILPLPDDVPPPRGIARVRARVEEALATLGAADGILVAFSTACRDASGCPRGYAEARQVVRCMRTFAGADAPRVLSADDLGAGRVVIASVDREEAERFASHTLQGLTDGSDASTTLLRTLRTFFDCSRSVRRSAEALDVHENTVRYRLARIGEITGLDVAADSHDQLTVQLAVLVLQLQGRCDWGSAEPADDDEL